MPDQPLLGRSICCVLWTAPVGWRTPQFRPLVLGTRTNKRGKRVPNVRVETYLTKTVSAFWSFALPVLRAARLEAAAAQGVTLEDDEPFLRGPICLRIRAVLPLATIHHRVRTGSARARSIRKPDLTNVVKLTEDAATVAAWWPDDCYVAEIRADAWTQAVPAHRCPEPKSQCREGEAPCVRILAFELEPEVQR